MPSATAASGQGTRLWAPFIDGRHIEASPSAPIEVINPSTEVLLHQLPEGSKEDVDACVLSARRAADDGRWSNVKLSCRKQVLLDWAERIASDPLLDRLDAEEMGKPVGLARANAKSAASLLRFHAEAVDKVAGVMLPSGPGSFVADRLRPMGVVGAIVAWNFPTYNALLKLAPALAAGNSVVLKPSELATRSAVRLAEIAREVGVPDGVFNVLPGRGEITGRGLALHSQVDMISFTGSTVVGRKMLEYSARSNMKKVVAECGGKGAHIVFDDCANVDETAAAIADLILSNQGQICSTGSRVIVHRSIEVALLDRLVTAFSQVKVGVATDSSTTFGPLASRVQRERTLDYIRQGLADGAELLTGGSVHPGAREGFFVEPTIFRRVPPHSSIAQQEIFGPVLSVLTFETEQQAIALANGTVYGLLNYVWTTALGRALRLADSIKSPLLVNAGLPSGEGPGHALSVEPWGESGVGVEGGVRGLESYMRRQLVWFNH
jgi:acyl-CoA reductase-like NAD-dependent aldehyde dehydrogenase